MKYLIQDGEKIKKATMKGLEVVKEEIPNAVDFETHGTRNLSDIIGVVDKEFDMEYKQDLGDKKLYGCKLVGYKDIERLTCLKNNGNKFNAIKKLDTSKITVEPNISEEKKQKIIDEASVTLPLKTETIFDFFKPINIDSIEIKVSWGPNASYTVKIYGSNDNKSWEQIDSIRPDWYKKENLTIRDYSMQNYVYRYIKLFFQGEGGKGYTPKSSILNYIKINTNIILYALIKMNNKYYSYQNNEFIEIEPTKENFALNNIELSNLTMPDKKGIKPIITLNNPELIILTNVENPQLYIKGFKDLMQLTETDNPKLLIHPGAEEGRPVINVKYKTGPQLILPTGDIYLKMLDKIHNFTIYSNKNQSGDIKIVFSVDSGNIWQTYNPESQEFERIDISNMTEIKEKGIEPDTFNAIGEKWNDIIIDDKIRFAYYLEINSINDIAEVDKLEVKIDMHGRWKKAEHMEDYDYEYDNEHIYVSFFKDGSYKINYQE